MSYKNNKEDEEVEEFLNIQLNHDDISSTMTIANDGVAINELKSCDVNGNTAVHHACSNGQFDVCKYLRQNGVSFSTKTNDGNDGRHLAAMNGHENIVRQHEWFMLSGPFSKNKDGNTFVHLASIGGYESIVKYAAFSYPYVFNEVNNNGQTALHLAAIGGHIDIIFTLVNSGAYPEIKDKVLFYSYQFLFLSIFILTYNSLEW